MGKNVVVAGRSKNVGMPIAMLLHTDGRHERPGGWLPFTCVLSVRLKMAASNVRYQSEMLPLLQAMPRSPFLTATLPRSNFDNTQRSLILLWLQQVRYTEDK